MGHLVTVLLLGILLAPESLGLSLNHHDLYSFSPRPSQRSNSRLPAHLLPENQESSVFMRRYGPFEVPDRASSVYGFDEDQVQPHQLAQRKLLLPVISEGYASTNFQGGPEDETKKKQKTPEPATTTTTTTRRPRPKPRPRPTTTAKPPIVETFASEDIPQQLSQSVIDSYVSGFSSASKRPAIPLPQSVVPVLPKRPTPREPDRDRHYFTTTQPAQTVVASLSVPQGGQRREDLVKPLVQTPPRNPIRPLVDPESGEPLELYTGELITADNNPNGEDVVQFSFSQPNQNIKPEPVAERETYFKPDPATQVYQAGYEQIDLPQHQFGQGQHQQHQVVDPSQYHEDRPNLPVGERQTLQDFYPLGKPPTQEAPQQPPPPPPRARPPPPGTRHPRPVRPQEARPTQAGGSFLDFLIPSFMRGTKNEKRPPPRAPRPPVRPTPAPTRPAGPTYPTPPPNIQHLFPPPNELGGALNPIMLRVSPEGIPQLPYLGPKRSNAPDNIPMISSRRGEESLEVDEEPEEVRVKEDNEVDIPLLKTLSEKAHHIRQQYKVKLQDPKFHQSLTRAHIYHHDLDQGHDEVVIKDAPVNPPPSSPTYSLLQDSNPFHFQAPDSSSTLDLDDIRPGPLRPVPAVPQAQDETPEANIEVPSLLQFAPAAKPAQPHSRTSKPDKNVVFNRPTFAPTTTTPTTTSTVSTTTEVSEEDQVIAEHVSSLLKQFFAMPREEALANGVPNLYVKENGVVMEYLAPDGEHVILERPELDKDQFNEIMDTLTAPIPSSPVLDQEVSTEEELEMDVPSHHNAIGPDQPARLVPYTRHPLIESLIESEELILPQDLDPVAKDVLESRLEQMFVPSDTPDSSDWFVLDDLGRRVMKNRVVDESQVVLTTEASSSSSSSSSNSTESSSGSKESTEEEGGFYPSHGPN